MSDRSPELLPGDAGVSLMETVVAVFIFAIVSVAAGSMLMSGIGLSRDARARTTASLVAAEQMEQARAGAVASFPTVAGAGTTTVVTTVDSTAYTVTQTAGFISKDTASGACGSTTQGGATGVQPVLLLTESVTWPGMRGTTPVTTSTTLTPPVGTYSALTGNVDLRVIGKAGGPVSGIALSVTTPAGAVLPLTTSSAGCAFLAYQAVGAYTVVASAPGYVDTQEQSTSTQTLSVVSGQVSRATFYVDVAVQLNAVLVSVPWSGIAVPPASGLPVSVGNSGLAVTGSYTFGSGVTALKPLYPYATYGVWAGRCPEAYPSAVGVSRSPLYAGASTITATPVTGVPTNVTVPVYPLSVTALNSSGVPVNGLSVTLTEQAGVAGTACSSLATYGLSSTALVGAANGVSLTGVPLGTFTVNVTRAGVVTRRTVTVTPAGLAVTVSV